MFSHLSVSHSVLGGGEHAWQGAEGHAWLKETVHVQFAKLRCVSLGNFEFCIAVERPLLMTSS